MNVTIIGAGYVGLVSGCSFAEFGASATCADLNESRIAALEEGRVPIYEPGLDQLLAANTAALGASSSAATAKLQTYKPHMANK